MTDWAAGIFPIMTIMAGIVGIITILRFTYVNNQYAKIIRFHEFRISTLKKQDETVPELDKIAPELDEISPEIYHLELGRYKSKHHESKNFGIWLDMFALSVIIIVGIIAVFGTFQSGFIWMPIILLIVFPMPLVHFFRHLKIIEKSKIISRS